MHKKNLFLIFVALIALVLVQGCATTGKQSSASGVQITELTNRLRVEINGELFTEYYFKDVPRPFCWPLIGPRGLPMTRDWPMAESPDEEQDHPHHRSFWFAHGSVNGKDFWTEGKQFGKTVQTFAEFSPGKKSGVIKSRNNWVAQSGKVICTDERTLTIYNRPKNERLLDFEITIHALTNDVVLGDTKEGTMAVRVAETMRLKGKVGAGHIVMSTGVRDDATWGKRAAWCDYYGPVRSNIVGIAIFDHPTNPRHPTWWHVRDYGLFAANPFGIHDFEKKAVGEGNLTIPAGKGATFRYRFYLHEGNEKQANVAKKYKQYVREIKPNSP